jgi:hypothetical protein
MTERCCRLYRTFTPACLAPPGDGLPGLRSRPVLSCPAEAGSSLDRVQSPRPCSSTWSHQTTWRAMCPVACAWCPQSRVRWRRDSVTRPWHRREHGQHSRGERIDPAPPLHGSDLLQLQDPVDGRRQAPPVFHLVSQMSAACPRRRLTIVGRDPAGVPDVLAWLARQVADGAWAYGTLDDLRSSP